MAFRPAFTTEARDQLAGLDQTDQKKAKKIRKALGYLETNPRHQSLQTHEYDTLSRALGIEVWEAYVENQTPGAYRIFFHYGPEREQITVVAITPHP
jgi:hypothetical protein